MEARRGEVVRSAMFAVRKSGQRTAALQNLAEASCCVARASVLECGCPLPLSLEPLSADRTLQSHPACTVELRFETFGRETQANRRWTRMNADFYRSKQRKQRGMSREKNGKKLYRRESEGRETQGNRGWTGNAD